MGDSIHKPNAVGTNEELVTGLVHLHRADLENNRSSVSSTDLLGACRID